MTGFEANVLFFQNGVEALESTHLSGRKRASDALTILIADDHPIVREGLRALIETQADMDVIAESANGQEAVEKFSSLQPDVSLLDLRMPLMNGIQALLAIRQEWPGARAAIMSSYQSEEDVYCALHAGALGYVLKDSSLENLIQCIHTVADGRMWVPASIGAKLAKRVADEELTNRESEVLNLMGLGKSNREIASALKIAESTVKVHVTHILEKLKASGRAEAINIAVRRGLLHPDWSSNP